MAKCFGGFFEFTAAFIVYSYAPEGSVVLGVVCGTHPWHCAILLRSTASEGDFDIGICCLCGPMPVDAQALWVVPRGVLYNSIFFLLRTTFKDTGTTRHQLPPTVNHHQPPTTNHQPPTTNHQPPTTNHQPPTTNHQPPTTNHQPPTTNHHQLPTANCHQLPTTANRQPLFNTIFVVLCPAHVLTMKQRASL